MKTYKYMLIILLTLGFVGCSQEEDLATQGGDGQEVTIQARTATEGETFTGDFTLELWYDGMHTTHPMTYTEGTGWSAVKVNKAATGITALAHRGDTVKVTSSDSYSVALSKTKALRKLSMPPM